jgi:mRNA interferase RelE/StbE
VIYRLEITATAERQIAKIDRPSQIRIRDAIRRLAFDPRPPGCRKLAGTDAFRIRVGAYRVIYGVEDDRLVVLVLKVGHRKDTHR